MLGTYLPVAFVSLSTTIASPSLSRRPEGYIPLTFTTPLPQTVNNGQSITLAWTGGSGTYNVQMDSSTPGSKYTPVDVIKSTTETQLEYTVHEATNRLAFAIFDLEQFATGEPAPGSWVNTGYIPVYA